MRFIQKAAVVAALTAAGATMTAAPAMAAGSVARYQTTTYTITSSIVEAPGADHTYSVTQSPCDGSISGTGQGLNGNNDVTESITGSLSASQLVFHAVYTSVPSSWNQSFVGYYYDVTATVASDGSYTGTATDSLGGHYTVVGNVIKGTTSSYANHGQYVSSQGGGSDAANSCIGMPVQSNG